MQRKPTYQRKCIPSNAFFTNVDRHPPHSLRNFYFLVDTLRSIHFHTPSTVELGWSVRLGPEAEYDFKSLCNALVLEKRGLPATLSTDEYTLVLVSILSDINALSFSVGPLTSVCRSIREEATRMCDRRGDNLPIDAPSSASDFLPQSCADLLRSDSNPHIPFTADHEYSRIRKGLGEALEVWMASFQHRRPSAETGTNISEVTVLPLFHFCRLLLEVGPAFYILPALAGYVSEEYDMPTSSILRPCEPHKIGIRYSDEAIRIAMEILESMEAAHRAQSSPVADQPRHCHPMWYPLAIFYGALVVWGRVWEDEARNRSSHILLSSRRLMQMFHTELESSKRDWSCASQMAAVIANLIS